MPACSTSPLRSLHVSHHLHAHSKARPSTVWHRGGLVRCSSTAAASTPQPTARPKHLSADVTSTHNRALTALYKTVTLLPRVISSDSRAPTPRAASLEFWEGLLARAQSDLNQSPTASAARVVVYGCDEFSGAQDLVTAILEEPFAAESLKQVVRERWKVVETAPTLIIKYGAAQPRIESSGLLSFPSSWLQQLSVPTELQELPHNASTAVFTSLYSADIPIIVCNPITTPLSTILTDPSLPLNHPNAILVVNSSAGPVDLQAVSHKLFTSAHKPLTTVFADSKRALTALDILSSDPGSATNVQRYQDGFTESNITNLTLTIASKLSAASSNAGGSLSSFRVQNALQLLRDALYACQLALKDARREVDSVHIDLNVLRDQIAEMKARVGAEVLGSDEASEVKIAVEKAREEVTVTMDRLTWWRLLWRVDDVAAMVTSAISSSWCRGLEDKLIYHSGRLSAIQKSFSKSTDTLLVEFPAPSSFHSPVLQNTLSQLQASPTYPLHPASLTSPIHTRRNQLTYPTNALHRTAQRVTVGMGGSVLGGLGVAWAGWAGQLGILGSHGAGMEAETAAGIGMLGAAIGVRWAVGKWERAKRRWWSDWDRVGQGLERDLKATLARVVSEQVTAVPEKACGGLCELARKRKDEIENLREEVLALEDETRFDSVNR